MARGKYAHRGGGVKLPVVLIMLIVAILAVIFAVTALVKALNNKSLCYTTLMLKMRNNFS